MQGNKLSILNTSWEVNQPVAMRLRGFDDYFEGFNKDLTNNLKSSCILISMPPFRNFKYFLNPKNKIILDIRDGWSIAQKTGYGGNVKPKPFKAALTRVVERFLIKRAFITITCTDGLQEYLQKLTKKEVLLIPNGVLDDDYLLAQQLLKSKNKVQDCDELIFCCAGQFSEYGSDKVKKLCDTIIERYAEKRIKIQLIGSNKEKNDWVASYLRGKSNGRAYLEVLPRMDRNKLYQTMVQADYGMTILRDPAYDFGTKIYDYIALGLPVVNYFDKPNNFTSYFDACLDVPFNKSAKAPEIRRSKLIADVLDNIEF